ncbi:NACHT, LRR and PYD domains-containing protein 9-like [Stylophora pistillata]|uniref:NACHT, LRR and PYD domains-containing protein 9-like n=1 Tax=Stylophora pistillata TaxID=50429 RepID=UPI000C04969B|nr:NACHT, LRR and PYD domains-containing protein 9-like [Stylophora pistillata]
MSSIIALENAMYPTIRSGLAKFDVSLPEELQSYVSYLFNESAKLGFRKRALHSLSSVEELREAMDKYKLKTFLRIHITEGAWQVALLFMDELPSDELPRDWFVDAWYRWEEEEEMIGSSLYSSTSGILKAWPTEYDPDLVTLCKAITDRFWKVTRLILFGSWISEEGLKNLGTALTQGKLYSLTLCRSGLQSQRLEHLCEALTSVNCNLTSLNFSDNRLGDEEIMRLSNVLTSVNCKLTSLNVSDNELGDEGTMRLCNVLTSVNCKLTSLNVSGNYCGSEGLNHLCDALVSTNCTLTSLNVSSNRFRDEDIMDLFTVLTSTNCTLTSLDVSWSEAGDRAVKELARALTSKNCVLTSLDISRSEIGDEGIKYLCKALTDPNCKLRSLDLRENWKVTDVGKQCLSEAITGTDWEVREGLSLFRSIKSEA